MLMSEEESFSPRQLLLELKRQLQYGLVNPGGIGEQLTAFIYILARDACIQDAEGPSLGIDAVPLTTVSELLSKLNPASMTGLSEALEKILIVDVPSIKVSRKNLDVLLQGKLSFLQFIEITYTPTIPDLVDAFLRGVAFVCRAGQAGVDLVIPVLLTKRYSRDPMFDKPSRASRSIWPDSGSVLRESTSSGEYASEEPGIEMKEMDALLQEIEAKKLTANIDPGQMTCLCIQVKNSSQNLNDQDTYTNPWGAGILGESDTSRPSLSVKHVLGGDPKLSYRLLDSMTYMTVFHGIQTPGIAPEVEILRDLIAVLLDTYANPLVHIDPMYAKVRSTALSPASFKIEKSTIFPSADQKRKAESITKTPKKAKKN
jgi:hypothetical protein